MVSFDLLLTEGPNKMMPPVQMSDAKGELIHQTLMARKMQKLDESGDYRLFKFRIQAFTGRFSDELEKDSLNDSVFPHKLVGLFNS